MEPIFTGNPRDQKAKMILASMSPDMVADIIQLSNAQGSGLVDELFGEVAGPPKPLGIMSRDYVSDRDFQRVWMGLCTIFIATLKNITGGVDYYTKILQSTFDLPSEAAAAVARQINVNSVLAGLTTSQKQDYFNKILQQVDTHLGVFEGPNTIMKRIGQQLESANLDFLYEMGLLGDKAADFMSMVRLTKGQSLIHAATKLLPGVGDPSDEFGDVTTDDDEAATLGVVDAAKPLIGNVLPQKVMGGFHIPAFIGNAASKLKLNKILSAISPGSKEAVKSALNGDGNNLVAAADNANVSIDELKGFVSVCNRLFASGSKGDPFSHIKAAYGDVVAREYSKGNIPGMYKELVELAGDVYEPTGDPDDEEMIAQLVGEVQSQMDDQELAFDQEIGGLFTRGRINNMLRRRSKHKRKAKRQRSRAHTRDIRSEQLMKARHAAKISQAPIPEEDEDYQGDNEVERDPYPEQRDEVQQDQTSEEGSYDFDNVVI